MLSSAIRHIACYNIKVGFSLVYDFSCKTMSGDVHGEAYISLSKWCLLIKFTRCIIGVLNMLPLFLFCWFVKKLCEPLVYKTSECHWIRVFVCMKNCSCVDHYLASIQSSLKFEARDFGERNVLANRFW